MKAIWRLLGCVAAILSTVQAQDAAQAAVKFPKSIVLSYEILGSTSSAKPLAVVNYDPNSLDYVLASWTPPSLDSLKSTSIEPTSAPLLRVLLPNGGATIAGLDSFDTNLSQNIDIWISRETGEPLSASVVSLTPPPLSKEEELQKQKEERLRKRGKTVPTSNPKAKSKSKKVKEALQTEKQAGPVVQVNLLLAGQGPAPKLNSRKPPQVDAEGREIVIEEQPEKTFLQKYWFIGLAVLFILISGGGGKD